jgi:hypothetical protein
MTKNTKTTTTTTNQTSMNSNHHHSSSSSYYRSSPRKLLTPNQDRILTDYQQCDHEHYKVTGKLRHYGEWSSLLCSFKELSLGEVYAGHNQNGDIPLFVTPDFPDYGTSIRFLGSYETFMVLTPVTYQGTPHTNLGSAGHANNRLKYDIHVWTCKIFFTQVRSMNNKPIEEHGMRWLRYSTTTPYIENCPWKFLKISEEEEEGRRTKV